ncbi:beta-ketoacyl-ACP synthase III [Emticicia fontis]
MKLRAAITGVHGYVPEDILTNDDLSKIVETSDEWITTRTGIKQRHIQRGEGLATSHMAAEAVRGLLKKTNTQPEEVELVICATVTPDYMFPSTANLVCTQVGIPTIGSFDILAACSGFLYALSIGSQFIESGKYKKVVVIGADKMSAIIDYTDRTTCVLFGDGAGAVLLEPTTEENGLMDFLLRSDGTGENHLIMKGGGSRFPASHETVDQRLHYIHQEGQSVFKFAVTNMADISAEIMERNNLISDDISWLVPHQANKRIIDATARRMGIGDEKVMLNIQRYGNTTAGTIPLCLFDYESQLKKGDNLILAAFGGGFTWGSAYIKWAY